MRQIYIGRWLWRVIKKVVASLRAADIDERLEVDEIKCIYQEILSCFYKAF